MIPKIIFRYSHIYDRNWRVWIKIYRKGGIYPSPRKVLNYIEKVEKLWKEHEKSILKELEKISKLKWKVKFIYCYVVGKCVPFSDPLTLPVYKDPNYFVEMLTHELIHQLFSQEGNMERAKKAWKYIDRKYRKESIKTRIHIPLNAFLSHIYYKFFGEKRLKRAISLISHLHDYKRAWEIVQEEGYQKIIDEFTKRII